MRRHTLESPGPLAIIDLCPAMLSRHPFAFDAMESTFNVGVATINGELI